MVFFEDEEGRVLTSEEVDNLSPWETDYIRKLHVYDVYEN